MPIYVWDNISCEVHEADYLAEPTGLNLNTGEVDLVERSTWTKDHVLDLPDGTRIVLESDDRNHHSLWVTTKEES